MAIVTGEAPIEKAGVLNGAARSVALLGAHQGIAVIRFPDVQQAAIGDCLSFDPFLFDQNGLAPPEVDVSGRQIGDALVI